MNNPAAVSKSDLAILVAARQTAENAEASFNTAVAAASGANADALQVGKIKNKGLRTRYAVNLDRWLGLMDAIWQPLINAII